jgi:hypothetical protein
MSHSLPQSNSNSDMDSDDDMNITEEMVKTNPNVKKIYQIQHVKDNQYRFKWVGVSDSIPTVPIDNFSTDKYTCYITNNFTSDITNNALYDLIDFNIVKNNGDMITINLSVRFGEINIDGDNEGILMLLMKEGNKDRSVLKANLKFPGNDKLICYVIREFGSEKIQDAINN